MKTTYMTVTAIQGLVPGRVIAPREMVELTDEQARSLKAAKAIRDLRPTDPKPLKIIDASPADVVTPEVAPAEVAAPEVAPAEVAAPAKAKSKAPKAKPVDADEDDDFL